MRLLIASMAALAAVAFAAPSFAQDETMPSPSPVDHRQAQDGHRGVLQQDQEQLAAQRLPEEGPGREGTREEDEEDNHSGRSEVARDGPAAVAAGRRDPVGQPVFRPGQRSAAAVQDDLVSI